MSDTLDAARRYLDLGWQPVAAPPRGKSPRGQWRRFQQERVTPRDVDENFARPANVFLITGSISGLAVLDCDNPETIQYWSEKLGSILEDTTAVQTSKGMHFYFALPEGQEVRSRAMHEGDIEWDLQAEGKGVVAPPSIHESGRRYEWLRGPEYLKPLPQELLEIVVAETGDDGGTRSILTHLLRNPPSEGGRNVWLSKIAGHYAKYIPHFDAFEQMVEDANANLVPPLPQDEIDKLVASIWSTEQGKTGKAIPDIKEDGSDRWRENLRQPSLANGWLVSGNQRVLIQVKVGQGEDARYELAEWMDADVHALGVVSHEEDGDREDLTYVVELRFKDGSTREEMLSVRDASDYRRLTEWMAMRGITYSAPDNASPRRPPDHIRFLRYLKSQNPPPMESVECLGWHEDSQAFITHDGCIRAVGASPYEHVRPERKLRQWAPYRYGFEGDQQLVRNLLVEILTFHDETITAVFGSWWAACLLKPQLQLRASQFPFMALEAASESGKTTGFFSLMMQLAGNNAGQINPTRAVLRDYLSASNNGIVWVDDLDSLDDIGELLRQVTVGGSLVKKAADNTAQAKMTMRSALIVSGESLGLKDQKALIDRAVPLSVPSPVGRKSLRDSSRPQWDDIKNLTEDHPDLTNYAGHVVQMALGQIDAVRELKKLRVGVGRHADTMAILRVGARVLRGMLGDSATGLVDRVDRWVRDEAEAYTGQENALTLRLIPMALSSTGWQEKPQPPDSTHRQVATPAFVSAGVVWFSPKLLAEWWVREPKAHRVIDRVESVESLEKQARVMGLGGQKGVDRKDFKFEGTQKSARYWKCPEGLSNALMERSQGIERSDDEADAIQNSFEL